MHRRTASVLACGLVATAFVPWAGAVEPTDPAKDLPKAGCVTLADPKGDTTPQRAYATPAWPVPNDPDLDLTYLTLRTTATELVAYIGVDKLAAGPVASDGHRFSLDFTFNKHVFTASASTYAHGSGGVRDGFATTGVFSHVVQLGVDTPSLTAVPPVVDKGYKTSGLKATWDLTNNRVVLDLPIADIVKYGGAPFTGDLTALDAKSANDNYTLSTQADVTIKDNGSTSTDKWTVGNNACFAPPPAVLTNAGVSTVQYGDTAVVAATLKSAAGDALAGRPVTFGLGGASATATTNASGVATAALTTSLTAGSTTLTESFAGDASADKADLSVPFTVAQEKTALALQVVKKGAARTVALTLLDDDKHAVAGQKVLVYVNGKLATTLTTSAAGKASFTKATPGQTVKAVFADVADKYLGSTAQTKV